MIHNSYTWTISNPRVNHQHRFRVQVNGPQHKLEGTVLVQRIPTFFNEMFDVHE